MDVAGVGELMHRLAFIDWARGVAVILMILCHVFNAFTRIDLRGQGGYILSQSIGGMASVLFLFLAGVTLAFGMSSGDRKGFGPGKRWRDAAMRGAQVLGLAFAFRLSTWAFDYPYSPVRSIWKVDILNCMGVAMLLMSPVALLSAGRRAVGAALAGCLIIALSPVMPLFDWSWAPELLNRYVVQQRGVFALFPFASHLAHGVAAGAILRLWPGEKLGDLMKIAAAAGLALLMLGQYGSRIPYTVYPKVDYWMNSPALMSIRIGIVLLIVCASYLWTNYIAGEGWSWVRVLGQTSLLVYFTHIMLVYGWISNPLKKAMTVGQAGAATVAVLGLMVLLAQGRLWQRARVRPSLQQSTSH